MSDCVALNEGEARELIGEANLVRAAQRIREMGPDHVVIKKGEHSVLAYYEGNFFTLSGYPLETVQDPAGKMDFETFMQQNRVEFLMKNLILADLFMLSQEASMKKARLTQNS